MGSWTFDTAAFLVVGAVLLYAWRTRKNPPAPLTPRLRESLTAMRSRGRTAFIVRTGVLGFGLMFAVAKTVLVYVGFYEWRQPELEPLARLGYWFVRMLPLGLLTGGMWGFFMWREQSKQFPLLDDSPPSSVQPASHASGSH